MTHPEAAETNITKLAVCFMKIINKFCFILSRLMELNKYSLYKKFVVFSHLNMFLFSFFLSQTFAFQ